MAHRASLRLLRAAAASASLALVALLTQSCASTAVRPVPSRQEERCLALTLYWEARGEGRSGMVAVGWTVLNRMHSTRFPSTVCGVVLQGGETPPCQFSWWCDGKSDWPRDRRSWQSAQRIAAELLTNPPRDPTHGAVFYHSTGIRSPWRRVRTARIGGLVFYR